MNALNAANLERFPQYKELLINAGFFTKVARFPDHLVRHVKPILYLLWGGALFVLLIGCLNVANLALVRSKVRAKEMATRLALGAPSWQLARQLVVENVLLTAVAGALGLALGAAAVRFASSFDFRDLPYGKDIRLDGMAALYALALALAIGSLLGLLPLLSALRTNPSGVLRQEGRGSTGGGAAGALRRTLVVGQVAFTFVLMLGAGLLLASFANVLGVDSGFAPERVATASVSLPRSRYADEKARRLFVAEALRRVRALPGVTTAGATDTIPFSGAHSDSVIIAEGYLMKPGESVISPAQVEVTPGYFEAMGAKLVAGRFFEEKDADGALKVVIVDRKLAARFWPGQDPIGRRLYFPTDLNQLLAVTDKTVFLTVVGVVADIKLDDITEGERAVGACYHAVAQNGPRLVTFAVKTRTRDASLTTSLRAIASPIASRRLRRAADGRAVERSQSTGARPRSSRLGFGAVALLSRRSASAHVPRTWSRSAGARSASGSRSAADARSRPGAARGPAAARGGLRHRAWALPAAREPREPARREGRDPRVPLGASVVRSSRSPPARCRRAARRASIRGWCSSRRAPQTPRFASPGAPKIGAGSFGDSRCPAPLARDSSVTLPRSSPRPRPRARF